MKTRTLLLLAVVCGMAILVAGTVQLLRVAGQKNTTTVVALHDTGRAGDATVVLDGIAAEADAITLTVTLGGVDDADGLDGFALVAAGSTRPVSGGTCQAFTVAATQCTLVFDNQALGGSARTLLFERAGDRLRWPFTV